MRASIHLDTNKKNVNDLSAALIRYGHYSERSLLYEYGTGTVSLWNLPEKILRDSLNIHESGFICDYFKNGHDDGNHRYTILFSELIYSPPRQIC
mgnify:CR=1 FL=1